MKNLRRRFNMFCFRNRDKGIPNLIFYIAIGNAVVYLLSTISENFVLYDLLRFDRALILQGQVWRLFTYAFTYHSGNLLFTALILYFLCSVGRAAEASIGTFRLNLYYLTGIILQDIFCMAVGTPATIDNLNFSLLLIFATQYPDFKVHLYFFIPVKAWVLVLIDISITIYSVIALRAFFPHNLFPLVAIVNYLLFFGKDALNLLPRSWRGRPANHKPQKEPIPLTRPNSGPYTAYTHRCTVCGRTDATNPELEFRYCSRCNGYHCYCEDHIGNHQHIE